MTEALTKTDQLAELEAELRTDLNLPLLPANLVFGEGDPDAAVMFIGEAPGEREDQLGRPFVGRAGQLLDQLIVALGWRREEVYITNIVKRRPPQNRDPLPDEIAGYAPYLKRQIEIISPLVLAPLGRFAMTYFLPEGKITRDQGKVFRTRGQFIYPLFHPAAALRSPDTLTALETSFRRLPQVLERCRIAQTEFTTSSTPSPDRMSSTPHEEQQKSLF